jgi:hypothetical protein
MSAEGGSRTGTVLLVLLRDPDSQEAWSRFVDYYAPKVFRWCSRWGARSRTPRT